jgi:hypothetical protein
LSSDLLCQDEETDSTSEGKVDLMKKPIPHLKGKVDLTKNLIPDEYGQGVEDMMNTERELRTSGRR